MTISCHPLTLTIYRQCEGELQATDLAILYRDIAAVEQHRVLDDRQAKTRATKFARATLVDTVEALEDMAYVLLVNTDAVIGKGDGVER